MIGLGNVLMQIPLGLVSDRISDRRKLLLFCATTGLIGMIALPYLMLHWYLMAAILFLWGGVVAGLYTIGLAHLGSELTGRELASANAAFVFCYAIGMLAGPQAVGVGMDMLGPKGFPMTLGVFLPHMHCLRREDCFCGRSGLDFSPPIRSVAPNFRCRMRLPESLEVSIH